MKNHGFVVCGNIETVRNSHIDPDENLNLREDDLNSLAENWVLAVMDKIRDLRLTTESEYDRDIYFHNWNGGKFSGRDNYRGVYIRWSDDIEDAKRVIDEAVDAANKEVEKVAKELSEQNDQFDKETAAELED